VILDEERWGRSLRPRFQENWKQMIREELEEMTEPSYIYIIINEWQPSSSDNSSQEIVGMRYFSTEDEAWDRLYDIADSYGGGLGMNESSFALPAADAIDWQEYRIEELFYGKA